VAEIVTVMLAYNFRPGVAGLGTPVYCAGVLANYLAGLKINLCQLETSPRIDAPKMIHETIALTEYAIQEVRTISHLLHPPLLEELGFLSASR
jgi:signal transduction histidine kinase